MSSIPRTIDSGFDKAYLKVAGISAAVITLIGLYFANEQNINAWVSGIGVLAQGHLGITNLP